MDTEIEVRKMECKEIRVDVRTESIKESTEGQRQTKILFQINHTMLFTDEQPVLIREYAWVGAGATILPGVCIGRHAIVGAGSVVTKDVPDYAVAVGNPAKVIKMLDKEKFQEDLKGGKYEVE